MIKKIRVLVVDDSIFFGKLLCEKLSAYSYIEVIGHALNAYDAKNKIQTLKPDVLTLDVEMPQINGIEFLKKLIPINPIPVVLVSSLNLNVFEALQAGAVDFVKKPDLNTNASTFINELALKINIASRAKVKKIYPNNLQSSTLTEKIHAPLTSLINAQFNHSAIIAIGASTGGTEAILAVLKDLPAKCPPILVVQHMPVDFTNMYAERLNKICKMEVKEAKSGDVVRQGLVLIAPGNMHMKIIKIQDKYSVSCFLGEKVSGHMPSVDVLFNSMAEIVKKNAIGIILTGMGKDGANGLLKMRQNGAFTIGQDKQTCIVYGMPMVAKEIGAVEKQAPLEHISDILKKHLRI